ncbi:MAG: hypothetical protein M3457_08445 [Chloroflexota bacterium]|nr:hypothetical protein [Chloroflexota bacterium]
MIMEFRRPSSLAHAMHQVLNDLLRGEVVTLSFTTEAEVRHVLTVLNEVAADRQIAILATSVGQRSLELSLATDAA